MISHRIWIGAAIAVAFAWPAIAQPPHAAQHGRAVPAQPLQAHPAPPEPELPKPSIPTQHAIQAGMGPCIPLIDQLANAGLQAPYNAQSMWNQSAPAQHIFQSVAGIKNPKNTPASGVSAIIAAPTPNASCDAVTVEVYPLAGSCADAKKRVLKGGEVETSLGDVTVITDAQKRRLMLLPGYGATCVALTFNSYFGAPVAAAK